MPEQAELDRLFGSEVGINKHYKKNMVVDATDKYPLPISINKDEPLQRLFRVKNRLILMHYKTGKEMRFLLFLRQQLLLMPIY